MKTVLEELIDLSNKLAQEVKETVFEPVKDLEIKGEEKESSNVKELSREEVKNLIKTAEASTGQISMSSGIYDVPQGKKSNDIAYLRIGFKFVPNNATQWDEDVFLIREDEYCGNEDILEDIKATKSFFTRYRTESGIIYNFNNITKFKFFDVDRKRKENDMFLQQLRKDLTMRKR